MCKPKNTSKPITSNGGLQKQLYLFPHMVMEVAYPDPLPIEAENENPVSAEPGKPKRKRRYFPKIHIGLLQDHAKALGGRCLSPEYITSGTKYLWECEKGDTWEATWTSVKNNGTWCPKCGRRQSDLKRRKHSIEDLKLFAESKGGKCHTETYEGMEAYYKWECAGKHTWEARWDNIRFGNTWCPYCSAGTGERICRAFFEQLFNAPFPKVKPKWLVSENGRNLLELDGYCADLGIAFEHQGSQHSVDRRHFKDENHGTGRHSKFDVIQARDARKAQACRERGILLVQIPSILEGFGMENVKPFIRARLLENHYPLPEGFDQTEVDHDLSYNIDKLEELRAIVKARGDVLLTDQFVGTGAKYKVKCQEGHVWEAKGDNLKQGKWCATCAGIATKTLADVQHAAFLHGGQCTSTEYVNNRTKLDFLCKKKHAFSALPANVLNKGTWCKKCASQKQGEKRRKYGLADLQLFALEKGGRCTSDEYTTTHAVSQWECEKRHPFAMSFDKVMQGYWCPHCAGNAKKTIEDLYRVARERGGKCRATVYVNIKTIYPWTCENGHDWDASAESVLRGSWCPTCYNESRRKSKVTRTS